MTSIIIPDLVSEIRYSTFYKCQSLRTITIGNSVKTISEMAFYYCHALESVIIPDSVEKIVKNAFYQCKKMTSLEIGSSVKEIGNNAFRECYILTSITSKAITPPILGTYVLNLTSNNLKIFVPAGSVNAYKNAAGWSLYASKIQAIK